MGRKSPPPRPDHQEAIALLRAITTFDPRDTMARKPQQAVPPKLAHPDAKLLQLCTAASESLVQRAIALAEWRRGPSPHGMEGERRLCDQFSGLHREAMAHVRAASKLRAATPAGIYAKALVIRSTLTGAAKLGLSLAEDLLDNPKLRSVLWEAEAEKP